MERGAGGAVRHLLSVDDLSDQDIRDVFERATQISQGQKFSHPAPVATLFYEASTRTEISFLRAVEMVGGEAVRLNPERSSVTKGETPEETVRTLQALGIQTIVIRTSEPLLPKRLSGIGPSIVNAGDGCHEHPTQALLDVAAITAAKGTVKGLVVLIVGDHLHSRVTRSTSKLLLRLGARVILAGPPALLPQELASELGAEAARDWEPYLEEADVVMALRIQRERQGVSLVPDAAAYRRHYGITATRFFEGKNPFLLMHPGPANVGIEVDPEVVDHPRSLIRRQVALGVPIRAAVLSLVGEARS